MDPKIDKLASEIIASEKQFVLSDEDCVKIKEFVNKMRENYNEPEVFVRQTGFESALKYVKNLANYNNFFKLNKVIELAIMNKADSDIVHKKSINKYFDIVGKNDSHYFEISLVPTKKLSELVFEDGERVRAVLVGTVSGITPIGDRLRYYIDIDDPLVGKSLITLDGNLLERI